MLQEPEEKVSKRRARFGTSESQTIGTVAAPASHGSKRKGWQRAPWLQNPNAQQQEWLDASLETYNAWAQHSRRTAPWEKGKDQWSGYGRAEKRSAPWTVAPAVHAVPPAMAAEQRSFKPVTLRLMEPHLALEVFIQLLP